MNKKCEKCEKYGMFDFIKLVDLPEESKITGANTGGDDEVLDYMRCSIAGNDFFRGVLLDICEYMEYPVVWMQRGYTDCAFKSQTKCQNPDHKHDLYERFESESVNKVLYEKNGGICSHFIEKTKNKKSLACDSDCEYEDSCNERDAEITDAIYNFDGTIGDILNKYDATPHFMSDGKTLEYLCYTCPATNLDEVAFPFYLFGKLMGVVITGQILLESKREAYNNLCEKMGLSSAAQRTISEKNIGDVINHISGKLKISQKTLQQLLVYSKKNYIRYAQDRMFDTFYSSYFHKKKKRVNQMDDFRDYETSFTESMMKSLETFCKSLKISSITVFTPASLEINADEPESRKKILVKAITVSNTSSNNHIWPYHFDLIKINRYLSKNHMEPESALRRSLHTNNQKKDINFERDIHKIFNGTFESSLWQYNKNQTGGYCVAVLLDESAFQADSWLKDEHGKMNSNLKEELVKILENICNFIRMIGSELQAIYHAQKMTSFTRHMQHEVGQLSSGTHLLLSDYNQRKDEFFDLLDTITHRNTRLSMVRGYKDISGKFMNSANKLSAHVESYTHNMTIRLSGSRYWNGLPEPKKERFFPYSTFLYKWRVIFNDQCEAEGYQLIMTDASSSDPMRPRMYADPVMIEQVAYNLMSNAIKYSLPHTKIYLDCKLSRDRKHYELSVINFGEPILESEELSIYEFGQRGSENLFKDGDGVGLYFSKLIAQKHGGTLTHKCEWLSDYNIPLIRYFNAYEKLPVKLKQEGFKEILSDELMKLPERMEEFSLSMSDICGIDYKEATPMTPYDLYWNISKKTARITFTLSIPWDKIYR